MKLTRAVYNRILRKRYYRFLRWMGLGEFHLVDSREDASIAVCGELVGLQPEGYIPGDPGQLCEDCYQRVMVRGGVA